MSADRKSLPPKKFTFWDKVQTPSGKGEIVGIYYGEDSWRYKTNTDELDDNDPASWWREDVLSQSEG